MRCVPNTTNKIKAQHKWMQQSRQAGRKEYTEGALMAKGDPWQDVFSAQLENNLGTRSAAATNETPGPCRSPTFYCFSF